MRWNHLFAFLVLISVFMASCSQEIEETTEIGEPQEKSVGTGILVVESSPDAAHVYVDGELKGTTPFTLFNVPVGAHNVKVGKEGYGDFEKHVSIVAGRREEIDALLSPMQVAVEEEKTEPEQESQPEPTFVETNPEEKIITVSELNNVELGEKFIKYFDFDNASFTDLRKVNTDVFSKNYKTHISITSIHPAKVGIVDKPIQEVNREDCMYVGDTIADLFSGQTLCVNTREGAYAALGGVWDIEPGELEWKLFS